MTRKTALHPEVNPAPPPVFISPPLPAKTTEQEDLTTLGQRRINLIWEYTQAGIAITVVAANMIAALFNVIKGRDIDVPMILSSSLFLIVGFYFSRTNHAAIGGEGLKPKEQGQNVPDGR